MKPNLFRFATSELSQDAVLCWILSWAGPDCRDHDKAMHQTGIALLELIHTKAQRAMPAKLTSVDVQRQVSNIDILCTINQSTAILIEDKVGTQQHSNQLARYMEHLVSLRGYQQEQVIPVYVQTGDQSDYDEVHKHGYCVVTRKDLLELLESPVSLAARQTSDVLDSFALRLREIEDDVQSFLTKPVGEWSWNAWKGFYSQVQDELGDGRWGYVANASGGFLGYWWHSTGDALTEVYLQMEQEKFCFKIVPPSGHDRKALGNEWSALVIEHAPKFGLKAARPSRVRSGEYMTVAVLEDDYRQATEEGVIDVKSTLDVLRRAQELVDACVASKIAPPTI